ncbi:MAG TPA: hypothetical protein VN081_05740 [Dongiaceae bacterium]|nr:hypothetical protein [Dongiaceae bacterium]
MNTMVLHFTQPARKSIKEIALDLLMKAMAFPNRTCHRRRDPEHVTSVAKPFKSPFTMSSELLNLFMKDPDFTKIIPEDDLPVVLEIGTDGQELRANLYLMDREDTHNPFDPQWPSTGVFRYLITEDGSCTRIHRSTSGVRYDPDYVIYSYARPMDNEERSLIRVLFR